MAQTAKRISEKVTVISRLTSIRQYSIIVPAYNNPEELNNCLRALEVSEWRDRFEIIVVDDCSPGESKAIRNTAERYGAEYYRLPKNEGPGIARNRGAEMAKGDILVFIDSDCVAPDGWLNRLTSPIRGGRCAATISCYCGPVKPGWLTNFQDEDYRYRMPSIECDTSFVNSCNFAVNRRAFMDCGGFPKQRISEDLVLGFLLAQNNTPARFLPDAGVRHCYYTNLSDYLRQRFSFAFNTVRSYLKHDNARSGKAYANAKSFNPVRTALSMFFTAIAAISIVLSVTSLLINVYFALVSAVVAGISIVLHIIVNGRFLLFLAKRQGVIKSVSYILLLYMIDLAYIWGVVRVIARLRIR
jgi:glycosyltransferase involved in cell wall biosynthesis